MKTQSNFAVSYVRLLNGKLSSFLRVSESRYMRVRIGGESYRLAMTDAGKWQLCVTELEEAPSFMALSSDLDEGLDAPYSSSFRPAPEVTLDGLKAHLKAHLHGGMISRYQWAAIRRLKEQVVFLAIPAKDDQWQEIAVGDQLVIQLKIGQWTERPAWTVGKIEQIILLPN